MISANFINILKQVITFKKIKNIKNKILPDTNFWMV